VHPAAPPPILSFTILAPPYRTGSSGVEAVTRGAAALSLQVASYDCNKCRYHDFTSTTGFLLACEMVMRVRPRGFVHFAPPCSSFTWANRSTSKRTTENPLGDPAIRGVSSSNLIVSRCVLLIQLAASRTFVRTRASNNRFCRGRFRGGSHKHRA
jgi:hypothetical protein